jgi:hypothetical protein
MQTATARQIAAKCAELIELASIFQARYGKNYRITPGSPAEAWDLHQSIFDLQTAIARLMDAEALERPLQGCTSWWKRQETPDTSVAAMVAQEASRLIACCASFEAAPRGESSPIIQSSQSAIAGMLHPSSLMVALNDMGQRAS